MAECIAAAVGQSDRPQRRPRRPPGRSGSCFEALARERPLVARLDDINAPSRPSSTWSSTCSGSPTDAPILLLCTGAAGPARPPALLERTEAELDVAPARAALGGRVGVAHRQLLVAPTSREEPRARIVAAAEGNPLFVEQLLALRSEDGDGETLPPTIQALLAARIDSLEPDERAVIERASVEGRLFHRSAVPSWRRRTSAVR